MFSACYQRKAKTPKDSRRRRVPEEGHEEREEKPARRASNTGRTRRVLKVARHQGCIHHVWGGVNLNTVARIPGKSPLAVRTTHCAIHYCFFTPLILISKMATNGYANLMYRKQNINHTKGNQRKRKTGTQIENRTPSQRSLWDNHVALAIPYNMCSFRWSHPLVFKDLGHDPTV